MLQSVVDQVSPILFVSHEQEVIESGTFSSPIDDSAMAIITFIKNKMDAGSYNGLII